MTEPCRTLSLPLLMLVPLLANAEEPGEPPCWPENPNRPRVVRYLWIDRGPMDKVVDIYVAGGVPTIIGLPAKLHSRGTGIGGGGQRRFDVLKGGRQILLTPTQDLADGERFPMWVTLADGMVISLSLTRAPEGQRTDGEVQLQRSAEWAEVAGLRAQLVSMTEKAKGFELSLQQALKERESQQYALADLIVRGHVDLTSLAWAAGREIPGTVDGSRMISLRTYASHRAKEIAALLKVENRSPRPLDLSTGRVYRFSTSASADDRVPVALRAQPAIVPPGGTGHVVLVMDREQAFGPDGDEKVLLHFLSTHQGGSLELSAELAPKDFAIPDTSAGSREPF